MIKILEGKYKDKYGTYRSSNQQNAITAGAEAFGEILGEIEKRRGVEQLSF